MYIYKKKIMTEIAKRWDTLKKYPFDTLEKGQQFDIPDQSPDGAVKVRNAANSFLIRNKLKWKFSVTLHDDLVYRCRRIK